MQTDLTLTRQRITRVAAWWDMRRRLRCLGSVHPAEQEAAIAWFMDRGPEGVRALRRSVHGPVDMACGASIALYRLGDASGVRDLLLRCYHEQWILRGLQNGHVAKLRALRRLGCQTVTATLTSCLDHAERERDEHACLTSLMVALSALRVLTVFDQRTPEALLVRALNFGPTSLHGIGQAAVLSPAVGMTGWLRTEAMSRLLMEYRGGAAGTLIAALDAADRHVAATAMEGLKLLRCREALPKLQAIAFQRGHPLMNHARRTIEWIAGNRADALILLRATQVPPRPEELLRPATAQATIDERGELLCPVSVPAGAAQHATTEDRDRP